MSYILDALRKSEAQRPPGTVPDLFAVHGPQAPGPRRRAWPFAAAALALAAAAFGAWVGVRSAREPARPASPSREAARSVAAAPAPAPAPARAPAPVASASRARAVGASASGAPGTVTAGRARVAPSARVARAAAAGGRQRLLPPVPAAPAVSRPAAVPAAPPAATPDAGATTALDPVPDAPPAAAAPEELPVPAPEGVVLGRDALPAAVRAELPTIAISGHVWSEDPSLRLLTVQDRLLREGAEAVPGVLLQEITSDGAIFNFRGHRFRVGGF